MKFVENVIARFIPEPSRESIAREVHLRNLETGREIAKRFTRGNVAIQQGHFVLQNNYGAVGRNIEK